MELSYSHDMEAQYILIDKYGSKFYFKDRELTVRHRTDGPAVEIKHGSNHWFVDGKRHRIDGPACEYTDGRKSWYIDGELVSKEEFLKRTAPEIVLTMDEIAAKLGIDVSKLKIVK